jgi:hypothetical protein
MAKIIDHNGYTIIDGVLQLKDLRIEGDLSLVGCTALTALPEGMRVEGDLDLRGCTALTTLPGGLKVYYWLDLSGCTALTTLPHDIGLFGFAILKGCTALAALPDGLNVSGYLELNDCTALTALPEQLSPGVYIDLRGCAALTALPDSLCVVDTIILDKLRICRDSVTVTSSLVPETVRSAAIGHRLGDVIEHWALKYRGTANRIIRRIKMDEDVTFYWDDPP